MFASSHDRRGAAIAHLELVRKKHAEMERLDRFYIVLAYEYGVTVTEIARRTGLGIDEVRGALLG